MTTSTYDKIAVASSSNLNWHVNTLYKSGKTVLINGREYGEKQAAKYQHKRECVITYGKFGEATVRWALQKVMHHLLIPPPPPQQSNELD